MAKKLSQEKKGSREGRKESEWNNKINIFSFTIQILFFIGSVFFGYTILSVSAKFVDIFRCVASLIKQNASLYFFLFHRKVGTFFKFSRI